jgi:single-stranded-DNA-specific exonuclease
MQLAKMPVNRALTAGEVGFRLAPRINAAGRMDIADDVVELFLTRDVARARELAVKLDGLNQDRRASEASALGAIEQELLPLAGADGAYPPDCLIFDHPDWHRGVLGILASRVVDRTGRPALVVTHADGDAHGSGRSIPGFHLLDAITAADASDPAAPLFHRFGGHAHAVGFSLPSASLPFLRARMKAYGASRLTSELLIPQLDYDAELSFDDFTPELATWIARCAPYGIGNAEPIFVTRNATLAAPIRLVQDKHVCLQLARAGGEQPGPAIPALGWSRGHVDWRALCAELGPGSAVDVLYRLRLNTGPYAGPHFGGLELELRGLRPATTPVRR